ncbi:hypothetical protein YN1HA_19040 [Sulfurisphaera ohwakuensis]
MKKATYSFQFKGIFKLTLSTNNSLTSINSFYTRNVKREIFSFQMKEKEYYEENFINKLFCYYIDEVRNGRTNNLGRIPCE